MEGVVGFDDIFEAFEHQLTSYNFNSAAVAQTAVALSLLSGFCILSTLLVYSIQPEIPNNTFRNERKEEMAQQANMKAAP